MNRKRSQTASLIAALSLFLTAGLPAWAQAGQAIQGTVYDTATNRGVPGVTVMSVPMSSLRRPAGDPLPSTERTVEETATDGQGRFTIHIEPGEQYSVRLLREGYQTGSISPDQVADGMRIPARPNVSITGTVIDDETNEPIAGMNVVITTAAQVRSRGQELAFGDALRGLITDAEGRFTRQGGIEGDYVILVRPSSLGGLPNAGLESISGGEADGEADADATGESESNAPDYDEDYEVTLWPNGTLEAPPSFHVYGGTEFDAGAIRVRKTRYYRAKVDLPVAACENAGVAGSFLVNLYQGTPEQGIFKRSAGTVRCGERFDVLGLRPGHYRLEVVPASDPVGESGEVAAIPRWLEDIDITDRHVERTASLTYGTTMTARVVTHDGRPIGEIPQMSLFLQSLDSADYGLYTTGFKPDDNGVFQLPNLPVGWKLARLVVPPSSGWVQVDTRFNGQSLLQPLFSWGGAGKLEFVLDDQAGTITGTVEDGINDASRRLVIAMRWPLPPSVWTQANSGGFVQMAQTDSFGRFAFPGLPDGEYRVLTIDPNDGGEAIRDGDAMRRIAERGARAVVRRGQAISVTAPVVDPAR